MAVRLSVLAAEVLADAAAIATEIGGGRTTAEITALAGLLDVLGKRNDLSVPPLELLNRTDNAQLSIT